MRAETVKTEKEPTPGFLLPFGGPGSEFAFTAAGKDAIAALDPLQQLFETNFEAAYA
jgi:hypothetical protein